MGSVDLALRVTWVFLYLSFFIHRSLSLFMVFYVFYNIVDVEISKIPIDRKINAGIREVEIRRSWFGNFFVRGVVELA
ncbi:unnamed protein product [Brugia timori]|uniref:Transmembrane protein n=1 Tax=Brugia timori TaxID=42155 RepID=A0A0R3R0F0_9BILA|nr:unnamed protein product [Brugia timori]